MDNVKLTQKCPHCDNVLELLFNAWTHELKIEVPNVTPYRDKLVVVEYYKKLRGYDRIKTWDRVHRAHAFKYVKDLLAFCDAAPPPVESAKAAVAWTEEEARRRGLAADQWNLGTVVKWSADFLKAELARRAVVVAPKCSECPHPALPGARVCADHAWCWKCDEAGSTAPVSPVDLVPQKDGPPLCRACAGGKA